MRRPGLAGSVVLIVSVLAGGVVAATVAGTRPLAHGVGASVTLHLGMAVYAGSVAAFVGARARDSRDPHAVFVATALATIALQSGIVAGLESASGRGDATRPLLWMWGLAVAGASVILAVPPWDRRGRPPVRPMRVAVTTALALGAIDVILVLAAPDLTAATLSSLSGGNRPELGVLGAASWLLGLAAIGAFTLASIRETVLARKVASSTHPWLATAWALAVVLAMAVFLRPTEGMGLVQVADVLQPAIIALVFAGFLAAHRDDTSRARRASDRAEQVLTGRAEIASMAAHEVRGPVATIKGLAATTLTSYDKLADEERREFVGLIHQESIRLLSVVDQTSLALKIDAGSLRYDRRRQALEPIVRESVAKVQTGDRLVEVRAESEVVGAVDRRWFGETIRQAVENATKFSPEGSPIEVVVRSSDGAVAVEVSDSGPGVPAERREEVFGKFTAWRPSGYEDRPGSGLGLFISRGLMRGAGGDASLVETSSGGTMLRIRVPTEG